MSKSDTTKRAAEQRHVHAFLQRADLSYDPVEILAAQNACGLDHIPGAVDHLVQLQDAPLFGDLQGVHGWDLAVLLPGGRALREVLRALLQVRHDLMKIIPNVDLIQVWPQEDAAAVSLRLPRHPLPLRGRGRAVGSRLGSLLAAVALPLVLCCLLGCLLAPQGHGRDVALLHRRVKVLLGLAEPGNLAVDARDFGVLELLHRGFVQGGGIDHVKVVELLEVAVLVVAEVLRGQNPPSLGVLELFSLP
mmetsp:Transcript_7146/g.27361  ORF Transcript_7146/g.27361 Transcript_7146/m.27361 type:complete len:248 (+) Transcript_7146:1654-2397(+)